MSVHDDSREGDDAVRALNVPLLCWHESVASARTDPLVALGSDAGFIATDRPVPVGTPVFLELSLGHASNAARAQIDAVVVSEASPVDMTGFSVRFVEVDEAVLTWIDRHLAASAKKAPARAPAAEPAPAPIAAPPPAAPPAAAAPALPAAPPPAAAAPAAPQRSSLPAARPLRAPLSSTPGMAPAPAAPTAPPAVAAGPLPAAAPLADAPWSPPPAAPPSAFRPAQEAVPPESALSSPLAEPSPPPLPPPLPQSDAVPTAVSFDWGDPPASSAPSAPLPSGAEPQDEERLIPPPPQEPEEAGALASPEGGAGASFDFDDEDYLPGGAPFELPSEPQSAAAGEAEDFAEELPGGAPFQLSSEPDDPMAAFSEELPGEAPFELALEDEAGYASELAAPNPRELELSPEADVDALELSEAAEESAPSPAEDALSASFSPWVDLGGAEEEAAGGALDEPFELDLPAEDEESEGALAEDDPPMPPTVSQEGEPLRSAYEAADADPASLMAFGAQPAGLIEDAPGAHFDPFALPSELEALTRPEPAAPIAADSFDPFADGDAPLVAADDDAPPPLSSDEFRAKPSSPEEDPDDLDVDVFDEQTGQALEPPPPPRPRDDLPGLAEAGVGFSNPFARATQSQILRVNEATRELRASGNRETIPWGIDRQSVQAALEPRPAAPDPTVAPGTDGESTTPAFGSPPPPDAPQGDWGPPASSAPQERSPHTAPYPIAAPTAAPVPHSHPVASPPLEASFGGPALKRTPTLEFPQPGPASSPATPSHTPTLREFAAVSPPERPSPPPGPAAQPFAASAPPGAPAGPRSLSVGFDPEDDVVEVSTTSQIVRAGEGGIAALVAKDKARFGMPVQSVTGAQGAVHMAAQGFPEPASQPDPFAESRPQPAAPALSASAQPPVWFPPQPSRGLEDGPPTGVVTADPPPPAEPWQVREPAPPPDDLPVVTGVTMLLEEEDELPLVQVEPLESDDGLFGEEPWVVGGGGNDGKG